MRPESVVLIHAGCRWPLPARTHAALLLRRRLPKYIPPDRAHVPRKYGVSPAPFGHLPRRLFLRRHGPVKCPPPGPTDPCVLLPYLLQVAVARPIAFDGAGTQDRRWHPLQLSARRGHRRLDPDQRPRSVDR